MKKKMHTSPHATYLPRCSGTYTLLAKSNWWIRHIGEKEDAYFEDVVYGQTQDDNLPNVIRIEHQHQYYG